MNKFSCGESDIVTVWLDRDFGYGNNMIFLDAKMGNDIDTIEYVTEGLGHSRILLSMKNAKQLVDYLNQLIKEDERLNTAYLANLATKVMNTQIPALQVLPSPAETPVNAPSSDLGRVRVDWQGRGHSSGSYEVLAERETMYQIEISTDPAKSMKYWISKARCEKVAVVVKVAA